MTEKFNFQEGKPSEEVLKSIEIPKNEIESFNSIKAFVDQISEQEFKDFDGEIRYQPGINEEIESLLNKKINEIDNDSSLSEDIKNKLGFQARTEAEYEAGKDVIEYKNAQLEKLLKFIEDQKIWKTKFSTASNVQFYHWRDNPVEDFKALLEQSEEMHKEMSFAGQNLNSIYFKSNSGASLRIKTSMLFPNGSIREVLQHPLEASFYLDVMQEADEDRKFKSFEFPAKFVSFEPKIAYRLEEFYTKEFVNHTEGDFTSKIKIVKDKENIVVQNSDGTHFGHYINKIYY